MTRKQEADAWLWTAFGVALGRVYTTDPWWVWVGGVAIGIAVSCWVRWGK